MHERGEFSFFVSLFKRNSLLIIKSECESKLVYICILKRIIQWVVTKIKEGCLVFFKTCGHGDLKDLNEDMEIREDFYEYIKEHYCFLFKRFKEMKI
jgi:hypothetical protein